MSVYFAKVGDYVKIGYSKDPLTRIRSIKRDENAPLDLDRSQPAQLLHVVPDLDRDLESITHQCLADVHVRGEWFEDCQEIRDFIATELLETFVYLYEKHGWCSATAAWMFDMPKTWRAKCRDLRVARELATA